MTENSGTSKSSSQFSAVRLLILIVAALAVALILYQVSLSSMAGRGNDTIVKVVGLDKPVVNRLDARFADTDNDLVADAPADAADRLDPSTLTFSFIATSDPSRYREVWAAFVDHLARTTGRSVEYLLIESSDEQLRALKEGRLHVTAFNTGNVPIAVNACGFVPVAAPGRDDQPLNYRMLIIVPSDSPLQQVQDLRGKTLALTSPGSNSGYKAPVVLLMHHFGLKPNDYDMVNSFSHEASIAGVAAGRYEAAAVASDMLARAIGRHDVDVAAVRAIYKSEPFPSAGLGHCHNLDPKLAESVRQAFFSFEWPGSELEREYASVGATQFVPISYKDHFGLVRLIDDSLGYEHKVVESAP